MLVWIILAVALGLAAYFFLIRGGSDTSKPVDDPKDKEKEKKTPKYTRFDTKAS
jgi:hypothetical protein